jgi:hypothetical protein
MNEYTTEEYMRAFAKDRSLAITTVSMAADLFGIGNSAVTARIKRNALEGIKISSTIYVLTASVLDAMEDTDRKVSIVKAYLEAQVRAGITSVEYTPTMALIGLDPKRSNDRAQIGQILGRVSEETYKDYGILLTVIVHQKNTMMPTEGGFFGLLRHLNIDWNDNGEFVAAETARVVKQYR